MWQVEQLKALEKYKRKNQKKYQKQFKSINSQIEHLIRQARMKGNMKQEIRILQAIRKGWKTHGRNGTPAHDAMTAEFFKLNDRKLDALIEATTHDMEAAETAVSARPTMITAKPYSTRRCMPIPEQARTKRLLIWLRRTCCPVALIV